MRNTNPANSVGHAIGGSLNHTKPMGEVGELVSNIRNMAEQVGNEFVGLVSTLNPVLAGLNPSENKERPWAATSSLLGSELQDIERVLFNIRESIVEAHARVRL